MISFIRKTAALTWLPLPPLVLSALVHMSDPDVDGWEGLASYSVVFSVFVFGLLAVPFVGLCLGTLVGSGWPAFLSAAAVLSVGIGLILTIFGSGATTVIGHAQALAGCTSVAFGTVLLAVIPASALGWPQALIGRKTDVRA